MVLFVDFALRESIGFTGVLWDWWVVNRCVLMCYFFIKYMVFGVVRENALFSRLWEDFRVGIGDFLMWLEMVKCLIFQCFVEVGIEVVVLVGLGEILRKRWFYKEFVDGTDVPGLQSNTCSKNVNPPGMHTEQTFLNIL